MARSRGPGCRRLEVRKQTLYRVRRGLVSRRLPSAEELAELVRALTTGDLARLGVVRLSALELDHPFAAPPGERFRGADRALTLLAYAALLGRDAAVHALLRAGADPSARASRPADSQSGETTSCMTEALGAWAADAHPSFLAHVVLVAAQLRQRGFDLSSVCVRCRSHTRHPLSWPCLHASCERCFWTQVHTLGEEQELRCALCPAPTPDAPRAPSAAASLLLFRALPEDDPAQGRSRPAFRACSRAELAGLFLGASQRQRSAAVFLACARGDGLRLGKLVAAGADLECRNEYGLTPLLASALAGRAGAVRLLLDLGADPCARDNGGSSLATIVCAADQPDQLCVRELRRRGLDMRAPGSAGLSALDYLGDAWAVEEGEEGEGEGVELCRAMAGLSLRSLAASLVDLAGMRVLPLVEARAGHPGAGSLLIDGAFSPRLLALLDALFARVPAAPPEKPSCSSRSYYLDAEGWVCAAMALVLAQAQCPLTRPLRQMKFLHYAAVGGRLPPHVDLSKSEGARQSTHTFVLYLSDCAGGETALLSSVEADAQALAVVQPRRGRLLLFPHLCPHEGRPVLSAPKLLLRGEAW